MAVANGGLGGTIRGQRMDFINLAEKSAKELGLRGNGEPGLTSSHLPSPGPQETQSWTASGSDLPGGLWCGGSGQAAAAPA